MRNNHFFFKVIAAFLVSLPFTAMAQEYKLRQENSVMGMKSESTVYVKGMRKRTEGGSMMGMPNNVATIEQCDLQRTVKVNDKKKLYFIEPYAKEEEIILNLYSDNGQLLESRRVKAFNGVNKLDWQVGKYPAGNYQLRFAGEQGRTIKFTKQ